MDDTVCSGGGGGRGAHAPHLAFTRLSVLFQTSITLNNVK